MPSTWKKLALVLCDRNKMSFYRGENEYHGGTYQARQSKRLEVLRGRLDCYPSEMFPSPSAHCTGIISITITNYCTAQQRIILFENLKYNSRLAGHGHC